MKAPKVRGFVLANQELVDGPLITNSCSPSSDEEVLLNTVFKQIIFINNNRYFYIDIAIQTQVFIKKGYHRKVIFTTFMAQLRIHKKKNEGGSFIRKENKRDVFY
jgi:hypothetical protein